MTCYGSWGKNRIDDVIQGKDMALAKRIRKRSVSMATGKGNKYFMAVKGETNEWCLMLMILRKESDECYSHPYYHVTLQLLSKS